MLATITLDIALDVVNVWHHFAITDFIPMAHFDKLKYVYVVNSVEGTGLETRGSYRTAETSKEVPTAWRVSSSDWSPSYGSQSGAGEFNTGEMAIATNTGHYLAQMGFSARFTSGSSARFSVHIMLIAVID